MAHKVYIISYADHVFNKKNYTVKLLYDPIRIQTWLIYRSHPKKGEGHAVMF